MNKHGNENGGSFDFSHFAGLTPHAKIALLNTLIKDPDKPEGYPAYMGQAKNGDYIYRSKENVFSISHSGGEVMVHKIPAKGGEILEGSFFKPNAGSDHGLVTPLGSSEMKASNEPNIGFGGNVAVFNHEGSIKKISSDGHAIEHSYNGSIMDGKLGVKYDKDSKLKIEANASVDIVSGEYSFKYYPPPLASIHPDKVHDVKFLQENYEGSFSAGMGFGFDLKKPEKFSVEEFRKLVNGVELSPISASPGVMGGVDSGNIKDYSAFLTEKDRMMLQNEAIQRELSGQSSRELEYWQTMSDPNLGIGPPPNHEVPPLTPAQRAELNEVLEANQNKLSDPEVQKRIEEILNGENATHLHKEGVDGKIEPKNATDVNSKESIAPGRVSPLANNAIDFGFAPILQTIAENVDQLKQNLNAG